MDNMLMLIQNHNLMVVEEAKQEIRACNTISEKFGLTLSEEAISALVQGRFDALKTTGRVEFGGGIMPQLIYEFCDSPYIEQDEYEVILAQLQDAFYFFKGESGEKFSDEELIKYMVAVFNGKAQGSVEYLLETSLASVARFLRNGTAPLEEDDDYYDNNEEDEDTDDDTEE